MDEVAAAIADPVRREILVMLRQRRLPAGRIADRFPISRPAVSRHLRVLRESGLVHDELTGRQRLYRLDPAPLAALAQWLAPFVPAAGRPDATATATAEHGRTTAAGGPGEAGSSGEDAWERHFDALETEVYRTRRERRPPTEAPARAERDTRAPASGATEREEHSA